MIIAYIAIALILCAALRWEKDDIQKIWKMKPVYKIKDPKERKRKLRFVTTFMYRNNIMWRSLFIVGLISTTIIYMYLRNYASNNLLQNCVVIFLIIFICFTAGSDYRKFHIYRVLGSKIDPGMDLLEDF